MRRVTQYKHSISGVFVFLLLGIFAISATVMVLLGAQSYKGAANRTADHNAERIAASYIRSKLREADDRSRLSPEALEGQDRIRIDDPEEGTVTLLYVCDGMLYEWYTLAQLATTEELTAHGESVCVLDEMQISVEDSLVTVKLRTGEEWTEVQYAMRSVSD